MRSGTEQSTLPLSGAKDYNFAMIDLIQSVPANESLLLVLGIISVLFFIITLTVIPWLILQIPEDYFTEEKRHPLLNEMHHPVVKIILLISKKPCRRLLSAAGSCLAGTARAGAANHAAGDGPHRFSWQVQATALVCSAQIHTALRQLATKER